MRMHLLMGTAILLVAGAAWGAEEESKAAKRLEAAEKLVRSRDYDAALVVLESILEDAEEADPVHVQALYHKAYVLEQQKKSQEALTAYNRCLELLVDGDAFDETERLLQKCQRAVLKLDKSRRIILRHADQIEREAARFKDKDEQAYEKMMEVVAFMRGAWDREGDDAKPRSDKAIEAALTKRFRDFYAAVATGDLDKAMDYVDPEIRKHAGDGLVKGHLRVIEGLLRLGQVDRNDISVRTIDLGKDKTDARVIGRLSLPGQMKDMDPNYWIERDGSWYLGDEKKLKGFE